jgi:hypothetical protein
MIKARIKRGGPLPVQNVPQLDPTLVKVLADGDVERANREKEQGPALSIFQVRDHGALLAIAGKARNALQYEIGNPITAPLMTRHRLSAALYAPIRVVLYENDAGHGVFEYDQPSTTFGQFGDERVTPLARGLDAALERALLLAAGLRPPQPSRACGTRRLGYALRSLRCADLALDRLATFCSMTTVRLGRAPCTQETRWCRRFLRE